MSMRSGAAAAMLGMFGFGGDKKIDLPELAKPHPYQTKTRGRSGGSTKKHPMSWAKNKRIRKIANRSRMENRR